MFLLKNVNKLKVVVAASSLAALSVQAAPKMITPAPTRAVMVTEITATPFNLPNNVSVNLNVSLQEMLEHAIGKTTNLKLYEPDPQVPVDPCDRYVKIRASVTNLLVDGTSIKVKFGFSGSQAVWGPITGFNGTAEVNLTSIGMVFQIFDCNHQGCQQIYSVKSDKTAVGGSTKFTVDFGSISIGPELIYKTPIGAALQSLMIDGLSKIDRDAKIVKAPWSARVIESFDNNGVFLFDMGTGQNIAPNQTFEIYTKSQSSGVCPAYRTVAYGHTTGVDQLMSTAVIDQVFSPLGVRPGDRVMIRAVTK